MTKSDGLEGLSFRMRLIENVLRLDARGHDPTETFDDVEDRVGRGWFRRHNAYGAPAAALCRFAQIVAGLFGGSEEGHGPIKMMASVLVYQCRLFKLDVADVVKTAVKEQEDMER